jgi:hypothetical protein
METLLPNNMQQFSHGFNLLIEFTDNREDTASPINGVSDTWSVEIVKPDGTQIVKTTGLAFPDSSLPQIAVPIEDGDFDRFGTYHFQVMKTTVATRLKYEVIEVEVAKSLPTV